MTETDPHPMEPALEEIVAYLDGELSAVEHAQVEQRLSTDESYRRQMQGFDRVWSVLDELPGVAASDRFSKTTMEMVVVAAQEEVQQRTKVLPRLRRKRNVAGGLLVGTAVLLGLLSYRWFYRDPNRMLIDDLPVIEHVDLYSQFQDIDFLRQLRQSLGEGDWAAGARTDPLESIELGKQAERFAQTTSAEDRRHWIDGLSPDQQLTLRTKYNRFRDFSPQHQQRLRQLHQQLISAPDAAQLQATMIQYQQWLDRQRPSWRFELRAMSEEPRVQAIVRQVRKSRNQVMQELTDEQIDQLVHQIQQRMPELRDHMQVEMSQKEQRYLASLDSRKRWWALLRRMTRHHSAASDALWMAILNILTEAQREQFQQLSRQDQWRNIFLWLHDGNLRKSSKNRRVEVGEQDLENFFAEELDAAQKEELLALPRDAMRKRLQRLYWGMEERSGFEGPAGRPPGPPDRHFRDGRPGPPRMFPPRDPLRRHDRGSQYERGPGARGPRADARQRISEDPLLGQQ